MKLLYCGQLWHGGTSLQRAHAFAVQAGTEVECLDFTSGEGEPRLSLYERARWKSGWPIDARNENSRLLEVAKRSRPDVVFVDNSKVISSSTLRKLKDHGVLCVYYSPDDIVASHNLKRPFRHTLPNWPIVFTTKSVNVSELRELGAQRVSLVGNSFDRRLSNPQNLVTM